MKTPPFATHGIEIEYMIVDSESLEIRPMADLLLAELRGGETDNEAATPPLCWSNELALHVIEVKTAEPAAEMLPMAPAFQAQVTMVNRLLQEKGACLMPTAMHPWMNPLTESHLWPHGDREIYEAFDRLFDCRGHGWTNLQSSHLNLPFDTEESFLSLYHAARIVLPLLPAICASSPLMDGAATGRLDNRLHVYQGNCARFPTITGQVIPEPVASIADYHERVLMPMYEEVGSTDITGELQHEWLNARGAIARFDRQTLEIRVIDAQEHPLADIALQSVTESLIGYLMNHWAAEDLAAVPQELLVDLFRRGVDQGGGTILDPGKLSTLLSLPPGDGLCLSDVWRRLRVGQPLAELSRQGRNHLDLVLEQGCLAARILRALGGDYSRTAISRIYRELIRCLDEGRSFLP